MFINFLKGLKKKVIDEYSIEIFLYYDTLIMKSHKYGSKFKS